MKAVIVIPARYASTRLPAKLLLEAGGKPLLQHTYERAAASARADEVVIAVDDERIADAAKAFGARTLMTNPELSSGSARVAETAKTLNADIILNVQGDEPEIDPASIDCLIDLQAAHRPFCSTLVCPFPASADPDDPSTVKAILGRKAGDNPDVFEALYFTRARAPFPRDGGGEYHLHLGIYAFRADSLQAFAAAPESRLEKIERLEQLRILERGEKILAGVVSAGAPGIDTTDDFAAFKIRVEKGA